MKYTDFKNKVDQNEDFSICLLEGEDAYFSERGLQILKKKYLTEPSLNLQTFEGDNLGEEFYSSLNAFPFMSEKRFTVVREFYPKADEIKGELKDFLLSPPKEDLLIIINAKKCESLKKYENVCVVDCGKQEGVILAKWVKAECTSNKVEIDMECAKLVVDYCLSDMTRISRETEKLIDFVGAKGTITREDINNLVSKDSEYKIYEMTDYIARKKFDLAIDIISDMLSKGDAPQKIITSVYNHFRKLLHAGISGKSASEFASVLAMQEYGAKKTIEQSAKFNKRALKHAVDMLADADYFIKSGKKDEYEAMWYSVFKIMTEK
ncbi:MAG: DNA polymerase III subunit delta [Clostridia bacterium]|nr:DNA polymerase III subunit delta [Clostridia bacterium]